jgi:peptidoglycan/LPS O-acetylase OafA/YrhL
VTASRGYRPALDGLRALAVVAVMTYHSTTGWGQGGFLGVDVFFVLSGYLITGLLLEPSLGLDGTGPRSRWAGLRGFYAGRARRLLPALLLVVTVVCVVGPAVLTSGARAALRGDALAALFYVANWRFVLVGESYFAQFGDPSPLKHLWTLAIEEQYYVVFPVVLMGLLTVLRGRRRRWLALILVASAAASALVGALLHEPGRDPSRIYYGTDTRAHELLIGAALAVVLPRILPRVPRGVAAAAGVAGLAGVLVTFVVAREAASFNVLGGTVLFSALVAVVIVSVETAPRALPARLLGSAPVAWVGRLSYSLYLWHWPVYVLLSPERTGGSRVALFVVQVVVTLTLATASYYLLEQPIRRRRWTWTRTGSAGRVAVAAVAVVAVIAVAATAGAGPVPATTRAGDTSSTSVGLADSPRRIVLVGDSVATKLAALFPTASYPGVSVSGVATLGCGTAPQDLVVNGVRQGAGPPECAKQLPKWRRAVAAADPQVIIWSLGAWEVYDHYEGDRILRVGSTAYATYLTSRMDAAFAELGGTARVLILNVPCYDQRSFVYAGQDIAPDRNDPERARAVNQVIDDFAAAHPGRVRVVDVASWLCPDGRYVQTQGGVVVRDDGVHYSEAGVARFWAWLMPQIQPDLHD